MNVLERLSTLPRFPAEHWVSRIPWKWAGPALGAAFLLGAFLLPIATDHLSRPSTAQERKVERHEIETQHLQFKAQVLWNKIQDMPELSKDEIIAKMDEIQGFRHGLELVEMAHRAQLEHERLAKKYATPMR